MGWCLFLCLPSHVAGPSGRLSARRYLVNGSSPLSSALRHTPEASFVPSTFSTLWFLPLSGIPVCFGYTMTGVIRACCPQCADLLPFTPGPHDCAFLETGSVCLELGLRVPGPGRQCPSPASPGLLST
jgi:hypothetical protein